MCDAFVPRKYKAHCPVFVLPEGIFNVIFDLVLYLLCEGLGML